MILGNRARLASFREKTAKRKTAIDKAYDELSRIVKSYTLVSEL
jgi:hypothetical protein